MKCSHGIDYEHKCKLCTAEALAYIRSKQPVGTLPASADPFVMLAEQQQIRLTGSINPVNYTHPSNKDNSK